MSLDKYTPGPWVAQDGTQHGGSKWKSWDVFADDSAGTYVAGVNRENECEEGNARLIAAAPDLLEACDGLLTALEDDCRDTDRWAELMAAASSAIAKARGDA